MDFRKMTYVLAIAEYQNLTKAAESLYVGQPTLSKFLNTLEAELGLPLFRKLGSRYVLTYAGERYVEKAAMILRLKEDLDAEMADILKRDVGILNVAFAKMRCSYMVPCVLPAFRSSFPNVKVNVVEGSSEENDRRLLSGQVDIAFYSKPDVINPVIDYHTLASEELLICTCRDHPLGRQAVPNPHSPYPKLDLAALENERVLMMQPQQRTRQIMDGILRENKIQLNNVMYSSNIPAIIGLTARGYGVSFVFETHLRHSAESLPVECYSFGRTRTLCDFVAAARKGSYLSSYAKEFIEVVRSFV